MQLVSRNDWAQSGTITQYISWMGCTFEVSVDCISGRWSYVTVEELFNSWEIINRRILIEKTGFYI